MIIHLLAKLSLSKSQHAERACPFSVCLEAKGKRKTVCGNHMSPGSVAIRSPLNICQRLSKLSKAILRVDDNMLPSPSCSHR